MRQVFSNNKQLKSKTGIEMNMPQVKSTSVSVNAGMTVNGSAIKKNKPTNTFLIDSNNRIK